MTCLDIFPDLFFYLVRFSKISILHSSVESKEKVLIKDLYYKYFVAGILGYQL